MSESFFPGAKRATNAAEFTVSEISGELRRTVEEAFGNVRVRGEISGYRGPHSSGHAYFALKDERSRIEAVIWKGTFGKLRFRPEEGMEVIAAGRLTTYPGSSKYQIVIDSLEPAGAGALMAMLEERKKRLAAEGLFSPERKQLIPFMPNVVGVVTSPTGAVIRDILHRIADRFPVHVLVWPVRVQGETAGPEATAAVAGFNALAPAGPIPRPDVLIVARGGGSLEDLWGFNDENLARAVAASDIPVISAVGHETDWTLIDLAADRRAPTPTGAAEMAVPVRAELEAAVASLGARLRAALFRTAERRRQVVRAAARALPSPDTLLALPRRRLDESASRLDRALSTGARAKRARLSAARLVPSLLARRVGESGRALERAAARLPRVAASRIRDGRRRFLLLGGRLTAEPLLRRVGEERRDTARLLERLRRAARTGLAARRERALFTAALLRFEPLAARAAFQRESLDNGAEGLRRVRALVVRSRRNRLAQAGRLLQTLSYAAVLERGFAVVRDADGAPVTRAEAVRSGERLTVEFADARVETIAASVPGDGVTLTAAPRKPKRPAAPQGDQGSLF
jgi:exodeoxyribonuclease VII large subunit